MRYKQDSRSTFHLSNSAQGSKDDKYVDDINSEIYNLNADDELLKRYYYDNIRTNKGVMCAY